jgi:hypothetical protein
MPTFVELDHPRSTAGRFEIREQSAPELALVPFDISRLSGAQRADYAAHVAESTPSGRTRGEIYAALTIVAVCKRTVWTSRGMPPQLLWQLDTEDGGSITVPAFVAKAATATDVSDELEAAEFRARRARVSYEKALEARSRRSGRIDAAGFAALRKAEDRAAGKYLAADAIRAEIEVGRDLQSNADHAAAVLRLNAWNAPANQALRDSGYLVKP